jgi:hypothetical protein
MANGVRIGVLLGLAFGCTTRQLIIGGTRTGGGGGVPGADVIDAGAERPGSGGIDYSSCRPAGGAAGATGSPPAGTDGNTTPGAPVFIARTPNKVGGTPHALAIADLNGDGRPDVVTLNGVAASERPSASC